MRRKMAIFKVGNSVCRGPCFSGALISYSERNEQLGAMRQKIAIFKVGNSVCRCPFFQELSLKSGGRCDRKWQFWISKRETAFAGTQKFKMSFLFNYRFWNFKFLNFKFLKYFRSSHFIATLHSTHIFWDSWDNIFQRLARIGSEGGESEVHRDAERDGGSAPGAGALLVGSQVIFSDLRIQNLAIQTNVRIVVLCR